MDIAEWLTAQLDEAERVARAASPGPWTYGDIDSIAGGTIYDATVAIASVDYDVEPGDPRIRRDRPVGQADATGEHIALHDPRSVLADIAAKRRLVNLTREWSAMARSHPDHASLLRHGETVLRLLASAYSHLPGYDQSWAPQ